MRPKSMVLILIALGCGLIASIGISQVVERQEDDTPQIQMRKVFVATVDIPINEEITPKNVSIEEWPADKVPEDALGKLEEVENRRARVRIFKGDLIANRKLLNPNQSANKSDQIPRGWRVISVKVTMASAVSYLIGPGDRVDILVYKKGRGGSRTSTLMRNVTVFAVNSQISREVDEQGKTIHAKTISMLVKPGDVEKLAHAEETGRIRLSLRRPDEGRQTEEDIPEIEYPTEAVVEAPAVEANPLAERLVSLPAEPQFEMQVWSGGKIKQYSWDDVNDLPNELKAKEKPTADTSLPTAPAQGGLPFSLGPSSPDGEEANGPSESQPGPASETESVEPIESDL